MSKIKNERTQRINDMQFKVYRKIGNIEARPFIQGESLQGVSVSALDDPSEGGWIARNPDDHNDRWFINNRFFKDNYEEV